MRSEEAKERGRAYKVERAKRIRDAAVPLTQDRLKQVLSYDPETGVFLRVGLSGTRTDLVGMPACGGSSDGYVRIAVDDRRYRAHRLAFLYMTGAWPKYEIDHIDGNRTNNRWGNLRDVCSRMNKENRRIASSNSATGLLGASQISKRQPGYRARINGRHIGVFVTPEEAHAAYVVVKRLVHEGNTL